MESLDNFYIPQEQSIYLLSANDASKLKNWMALCTQELEKLGYRDIYLAGKGVYGFTFAGLGENFEQVAFKFMRIDLPESVQERFQEEAEILSQLEHPLIPRYITFEQPGQQGILLMSHSPGMNLEEYSLLKGRLSAKEILSIAAQLAEVLLFLREFKIDGEYCPIVHGDVKPSNIMYDPQTDKINLVDWGSSVYAQTDIDGQWLGNQGLALMSSDIQQSNARMGDVYFIGPEQLAGALSNPRFDEQGVASTLYALASGQGCRFGKDAIPATSLGLPKEFALILDGMLDDDPRKRQEAGDYWLSAMPRLKNLVLPELDLFDDRAQLPIWLSNQKHEIDTVVYASRKSFLRERSDDENITHIDDAQLERYFKEYLVGMADTEKAFVAAVSRLGQYPVIGGLGIHWRDNGVYIDSSLNLYDESLLPAFSLAVNNVVTLSRAIDKTGTFKTCLFNARNTIHLSRESPDQPFIPTENMQIPYRIADILGSEENNLSHSYFEDGQDPDEKLVLPERMMEALIELNEIHHTGCIIFEVSEDHLKLHNYYRLLDASLEERFVILLNEVVQAIPEIDNLGVGGFMKLPYRNTRFFAKQLTQSDYFYPANPWEYQEN